MNSTARSVVVTLFLLGALAGTGLVSILTNPVGPIAASERATDESGLPDKTPKQTSPVAPVPSTPTKSLEEAQKPLGPQSISEHKVTLAQQVPTPAPTIVEAAPSVADAPGAFGVRLSSDGLLPGRLNVVDPETGVRKPTKSLTVSFLQGGKVIAQVKPGVSGIFQVKDLQPGIYSMIATGADAFLAMAVLVLPPLAKPSEVLVEDDPLQIDIDAVHPVNVPLIRMMIRERLYPAGTAASPATKAATAERWLKERGKPLRTPTVKLDADGSLGTRFNWISADGSGRTPATEAVAYLIRDGVIASKSEVTTDGLGRFTGTISPGSYALMVVPAPTAIVPGKDDETTSTRGMRRGYCAIGLTVAPSDAQTTVEVLDNRSPVRLVSAVRLQPPANSIDLPDIDLVPIEDIEGAVAGSSEGLGGDAAGLAGGAPPARAPAGGAGGGGGGGSDATPLLVGGGIAGLIAAGSNLGSSNVSATATSSSSGGGGGNGNGGDGGGSPKAIK